MEGSRLEDSSSPLATSEDIQKRLVRPGPFHSQPSSSSAASPRCNEINRRNSSKLVVNSELQKKNTEVKKTKGLEDYLDPVLLSTTRPKLGGKRKNYGVEMKKTTNFDRVEWPGDHHGLMALRERSIISESSRVKQDYENIGLKPDSDSGADGG